ncbi:MAG TPA: lysylphosphatidylglycerol synthase transmembrane domain-containing protein [Pirellulaceae bacterium]|nr:lysylphosphatidylglycerol synthase transmembrane domain-containing protein [Pirellulaceae bacterium]
MKTQRLRAWAVFLAKYAVSFGLLGYLAWQAWSDESLRDLQNRSLNGTALLGAFLIGLVATIATFLRWRILVTALGIPFRLRDAIALGFIGHLFTFFTVGVVGGDFVKAFYIAQHRPDRKAEAVATVILDRLAGLLALFYVALFGYAYLLLLEPVDLQAGTFRILHSIGLTSLVVCVVATVGIAAAIATPLLSHGALDRVERIPLVGKTALDLLGALRTYRSKPGIGFAVTALSVATHLGFAAAIWATARGLSFDKHTFLEHVVVVPAAMLANSVPLPGGLGAFEAALAYLYRAFGGAGVSSREGIVVAFAYRIMTILYALIGVYFYLARRRQVDRLLHQAEKRGEDLHLDPDRVEEIERHAANEA